MYVYVVILCLCQWSVPTHAAPVYLHTHTNTPHKHRKYLITLLNFTSIFPEKRKCVMCVLCVVILGVSYSLYIRPVVGAQRLCVVGSRLRPDPSHSMVVSSVTGSSLFTGIRCVCPSHPVNFPPRDIKRPVSPVNKNARYSVCGFLCVFKDTWLQAPMESTRVLPSLCPSPLPPAYYPNKGG